MSGKEELILYKRKKASDLLFDAKLLYENKRFNSAVNRIYYAIFNEVLALLLTKDLASSKHSGVKFLFYDNFIKTNLIDKIIN
ncbi:MAG: HEPN domain-containing protein [Melioribacteraceae bacterium]|nr:HEPN domain-containing protein [Melioribacteraceae bacterium]